MFEIILLILGGASDRKYNRQRAYYGFILEFSPDKEAWAQIGVMTNARSDHGVSNVNYEDFKDVCTAATKITLTTTTTTITITSTTTTTMAVTKLSIQCLF